MEWVETTAKSVEDAKDLALDKLGVDEADAEFEILEEPRQGLFGRTRGEARVRARVEPKAPRAKEDRPRKRRRTKSDGGRGDGARKAETGATSTAEGGSGDAAESGAEPNRQRSRSRSGGGRNRAGTGQGPQGKQSDSGGKQSDSGGRQSDSGGRQSDSGGKQSDSGGKQSDSGGRKQSGKRSEQSERKESSMEEVSTCVEEFLTGLVSAFDIDTPVTIDDSEGQIMATIEGKHGLLLGPKARTLDAIQELTRVTAQRTAPSSIRIKVDVGGYREARRTALAGFARQAAEKAKEEGVDVLLEAMSAADRKVVHDTLNDEPGVSTRSAGTDPRRYVVVVPDVAADAEPSDTGSTELEDVDADS